MSQLHIWLSIGTFLFRCFTGASSSFPLDACDKSVTDISFILDLQGSIEDQKNFIADTEDYWMISTLYNVVKHNEQVEIKKISQHSEELANHSQQSQHQMSLNELFKFSQTNLKPSRPSGIHVVFIFISHSFFNATNFEFQDIRKQNYKSYTKLFLLAEDFIEGNNVYFAGSFRDLNFHEMYNLVCNKKCDASSLKYVNYDFKQAHLYVGPKLFHTLTYDESVLYCKKKFKNDLLYVETMDELKFVISNLKKILKSFKQFSIMINKSQMNFIDNVLLTLSSNFNASFTTYLTSNDCFYIKIHTNSTDLRLAQNLIKYPCPEILTDIIITCKCTTIKTYPLYNRLYIAQDQLNSSERKDVTCGNNFFKCLNSTCLQLDRVQDGLKDCPNGEDEYLFRISDKICSGTLIVRGNVKKIDESVFPNLQADLKFNESISKELKIFQFETNFYNSSHALIPEKQILKFFGSLDFLEIKSSHCLLSTFKTSFRDWDLSKIVSIDMSYNKLSDITDLNLLSELRHLNLSHNPNFTFNDTSLFPNSLQVLDLSYTNVHSLPPNFFYALKNLKELFLKGTKITKFYDIKIPPYTLNILDLRGLTLSDIQSNYFKNLNITLQILSDDFRICCPSVLGDLNSLNRCKAPEDIISSCEHLVGNESKKILIWIIGFLTLFGNAFIVFYRLKKNQQTFNKPYDTLVLGLAISDGMIGIYLIIIASADVYFGEEYFQFHYHWVRGNLCTFAAFLSLFSTQLSTCFITLITFDRFMATKYPLKNKLMSKSITRITILCLVIFEFLLCLLPAIHPNWKIFTFNGLCLALPVSSQNLPGWEYSIVVFLALNVILFVSICIGQILIFVNIHKRKQSFESRHVNEFIREQEFVVAKKLSLIAFSNLICWVPIGVMGICSLSGLDLGPTIYGWTAIVLLPINGGLNPLIYNCPNLCNRK